jgi:hypothetical protein
VLQPLTALASLRGSVEYGRLGLLTDLSYLSLQGAQGVSRGGLNADGSFGPLGRKSASVAIGSTSINASMGLVQGVYDLALRYRFGKRESAVARPGSLTVIPYAGIRIVNVGICVHAIPLNSPVLVAPIRQLVVVKSLGCGEELRIESLGRDAFFHARKIVPVLADLNHVTAPIRHCVLLLCDCSCRRTDLN